MSLNTLLKHNLTKQALGKQLILVAVVLGFSACAKHQNCVKADVFGHCKQWEGQEQTCKNPDFLGFCPGKRNKE